MVLETCIFVSGAEPKRKKEAAFRPRSLDLRDDFTLAAYAGSRRKNPLMALGVGY